MRVCVCVRVRTGITNDNSRYTANIKQERPGAQEPQRLISTTPICKTSPICIWILVSIDIFLFFCLDIYIVFIMYIFIMGLCTVRSMVLLLRKDQMY